MPEYNAVEDTKDEWRNLGFYYEFDKETLEWCLVGSRKGLLKLSTLLTEFANSDATSNQHEHLGPYMYLTLVSSSEPQITDYGIFGSSDDLARLSKVIQKHLSASAPGSSFTVDAEYSSSNQAKLTFTVKEEDYDPASSDNFEWAKK